MQYSALFIARSTINCHLPFRHSLSAAVLIKKKQKRNPKKLSKLLWGNYFIPFDTAREEEGKVVELPSLSLHSFPSSCPFFFAPSLKHRHRTCKSKHTRPPKYAVLCMKLSTSLICHCPCCLLPLLLVSPVAAGRKFTYFAYK